MKTATKLKIVPKTASKFLFRLSFPTITRFSTGLPFIGCRKIRENVHFIGDFRNNFQIGFRNYCLEP